MSGDGGITLFLRVADGNEQDKVVFGEIAVEYKSMIDFETWRGDRINYKLDLIRDIARRPCR